jgi:hypothetical protein
MKYWCFFLKFFQKHFGNDQYLLVLQILENSGRYWDTSIYQYMYQYCRYWKILVKYWYYQYCQYCRYWKILENTGNTSIADTGKYWLYQYCRYWKIR